MKDMKNETVFAMNLNYAILAFIAIYVFCGQTWALSVAEWTSNIFMTASTLIVAGMLAILSVAKTANLPKNDDNLVQARENIKEAYKWSFSNVTGYLMVGFFIVFYYTEGLLYTSSIHLVGLITAQLLALRTKHMLNVS